MKRVLEPELMDDPSQVFAYSQADFSLSEQSLLNTLDDCLIGIGMSSPRFMVDLGCGPGNISERLSFKFPSSNVLGIDGSNLMISEAEKRKQILKKDLGISFKKLSYKCLSLSQILEESKILPFRPEVIVSNSLLHHLPDPGLLWKVVKSIASPCKAIVVHRDLRRPLTKQQVDIFQRKYLPNAPAILVSDFSASLAAAFTVKEVKEQLKNYELKQLRVREINDLYLEVYGTL